MRQTWSPARSQSGDARDSADASVVQRHIGILESQYDLPTAGLGLLRRRGSSMKQDP